MKPAENHSDAHIPPDMAAWLDELGSAERNEIERTWQMAALGQEPPPTEAQVADATSRLRQKLEQTPAPGRMDRRSVAKQRRRGGLAGWTVALVASAVIAFLGVTWPRMVVAPAGERVHVTLADGSRAELNGGSTLRYRRGLLGGVRRVSLDGEAFFEVTHDGRPFAVATQNAVIEVMGTSFGVTAWAADASQTDVMLEEGAVRVRAGGGAVELTPGNGTRVSGSNTPSAPAPFNTVVAFAWRTGGIAFDGVTLPEIAGALERRYHVSIQLEAGVGADDQQLTIMLPNATSPADVLADICRFAGCTVGRTATGFVLTGRP